MRRCAVPMLLLFVAGPAAAEPPGADWLPPQVREALKTSRGIKSQGVHLQGGRLERTVMRGDLPDALEAGRATPVALRGASAAGVGEGPAPLQAEIVRVTYAECRSRGAGLPLFELRIGGQNPCAGQSISASADDPTLSPCERRNFDRFTGMAVAIPGAFGARGEYVAAGAQPFYSFACVSGVLAKCVRWGYGAREALFGACVRAAHADYCGTGRSFTCPGTRIDILDQARRNLRAAASDGQVLEADWSADGAVCLDAPRLPGCVSPAQRAALVKEIQAECQRAGRALTLGCPKTCDDPGQTCGRALRTYTYLGQGSTCATSAEICKP